MVVASPEYFIDDIAVIGQENEAFARLVKTSNRENSLRIIDVVNNVVFLADVVGGADNTYWFVKSNIDEFLLWRTNGFVVYRD